MNWGIEDLAAAVALFAGAGIAFAVVFRVVPKGPVRLVLTVGVVLALAAIWAYLAVGTD